MCVCVCVCVFVCVCADPGAAGVQGSRAGSGSAAGHGAPAVLSQTPQQQGPKALQQPNCTERLDNMRDRQRVKCMLGVKAEDEMSVGVSQVR